MMLLLFSFVFVVLSAGLLATLVSFKKAPAAYEDDAGFHLDRRG